MYDAFDFFRRGTKKEMFSVVKGEANFSAFLDAKRSPRRYALCGVVAVCGLRYAVRGTLRVS